MALGKNVRTLRKLHGWTIAQLSKNTRKRVGSSTIGNLEQRDSKSSPYASALAEAFEISLEKLIDSSADDLTQEFLNPATYAATKTAKAVKESEPMSYLPERAITIADITGIWLSLNPERQRRLLANAHDYLTAQRAEKPNDGNPYANVAAPLPPLPSKSPKITKAKT